MLSLAFVIVALVLALLAAFNVPSKVSLLALSLAAYYTSLLLGRL